MRILIAAKDQEVQPFHCRCDSQKSTAFTFICAERRSTKTTAAACTILASTLLYALADYMLVVLFSCYVG